MSDLRAYRIGWWTHRWWPRKIMLRGLTLGHDPYDRKTPRIFYAKRIWIEFARHCPWRLRSIGGFPSRNTPHRPWQCEADGCRFARRAFTAESARRKMQRDVDHTTGAVTGYPIDSPWQLRRTARANAAAVRRKTTP